MRQPDQKFVFANTTNLQLRCVYVRKFNSPSTSRTYENLLSDVRNDVIRTTRPARRAINRAKQASAPAEPKSKSKKFQTLGNCSRNGF